MNILVIGNGFDIAHGIPSSYKNFLDFVGIFKSIYGYRQTIEKLDKNERKNVFEGRLKQISNIYKDIFVLWNTNESIDPVFLEFYNMISDNYWISYFTNPIARLEGKSNWVDIEAEILHVIQTLTEKRELITRSGFDGTAMCKLNKKDERFLPYYMERMMKGGKADGEKVARKQQMDYWKLMKSVLLDDFSKLVRALELYLDYFIDFTKLSKSDIFDGIKFDRLVTFNYTNTYRVLYDSIISGDFIHGRALACRDKEESNVVLGIEEFLDEDQKNKDVEFISYRKYYQRIIKHCDFSYRKVLENSKNAISTWFFGHSLASSDKDILTHLLPSSDLASQFSPPQKSNVKKSYICYYSQHTLEQQVANLVQILGQEALNDLVCGPDPKIKFVFQDNFKKERMISMNEERTYRI